MTKIEQIMEGWTNKIIPSDELKDIISQASNERMEICKKCPLLVKSALGEKCNSDLYLNRESNNTSKVPLPDYHRGCGCILSAKTSCLSCNCPAGKWTSIIIDEK